jgi:penicillin-binding protein 1C
LLDERRTARGPKAEARSLEPGEIAITNPPDGATYLIDPTLRREFQTLELRAETAAPVVVEWQVDGRTIGRGSSERAVSWPLAPGTHRLTARDAAGRVAASTITVR